MRRDLLKLIEQSEQDGGVFLKDVATGQLVEAYTQNSIYRIGVISPEDGLVAVDSTGTQLTAPALYRLTGSTWGGSAIKLGWIGINMHLELWRQSSPGRLTTSAIRTIRILDQPEKAKELIESANKNTPLN